MSYSDYIARIDADDDYLRSAAEFGRGIRILRQDTWEMIITFILSQQNNIPRIKGLIRTLSERYGRRRETPDKRVYYTFPEAEALSKATELYGAPDTYPGLSNRLFSEDFQTALSSGTMGEWYEEWEAGSESMFTLSVHIIDAQTSTLVLDYSLKRPL